MAAYDPKITRKFAIKCVLLTLLPFALMALALSMCNRISDPVGNALQGISHARILFIEANVYRREHGEFPDLATVLELVQEHSYGEEPYIPYIESVENHHFRIYFISTLEATDGRFVFAASAPFRRDYSSRKQLYRIVVPAADDPSVETKFLIEEVEFQAVLGAVQEKAVNDERTVR